MTKMFRVATVAVVCATMGCLRGNARARTNTAAIPTVGVLGVHYLAHAAATSAVGVNLFAVHGHVRARDAAALVTAI